MAPSAGGAAAVQGADYQSRVAAWLATLSIASETASPLWGWANDSKIQAVYIETADEVDDIRVDNSAGASAFIQAKHRVAASQTLGSPLGKAMLQFVAQVAQTSPNDRLVLVTTSGSSRRVTETLPLLLQRARQSESTSTDALCRNKDEEALHGVLLALTKACWQERFSRGPTEAELLTLLTRLFVTQVDPYNDDREAREAKQLLRGRLLDSNQAEVAWESLVGLTSRTAILRSQLTPAWLLDQLDSQGIPTGTAPVFRRDIQCLKTRSAEVAEHLADFEWIAGDDGAPVHIERAFASDLANAAQESLLITGEPGSGKSGSLSRLVESLDPGTDVVFLAADSLAAKSLGELRIELGLQNDLADVLTEWRGTAPAYLVLDALDAGRGSENQRALLDLMRLVIRARGRWRVIATVRRFDLFFNSDLQDLFRGFPGIATQYQLPELNDIRHFAIPPVSITELEHLRASAPGLFQRIEAATPAIRQILANFFCLRIFADLVASRDLDALTAVPASQGALLDRYWLRRVQNGTGALRSEAVIRSICQRMVADGTLTVSLSQTVREENADVIQDLLRRGVLVARQDSSTAARTIGFAHHVLFDYAVSLLILRDENQTLASLAASNRTLLFLARPSFQMLFEHLWELDRRRAAFWQTAMQLSREPNVPEIARVIAPGIGSARIAELIDVTPLLESLVVERDTALRVLRHLISARLSGEAGRSIPDNARTVWAEVLESLIPLLDQDVAPVFRNLLREFLEGEPSGVPQVEDILGRASRRLLQWVWGAGVTDRWFVSVALKGTAMAFQTNPTETRDLIAELLSMDHLSQRGYAELPVLAEHVDHLWSLEPELVEQIYTAAFEFEETSRESTTITTGVLGLTSNRRQDYEHAHYALAQHFPAFLRAAPGSAISALAAIWRKYSTRYGTEPRTVEIAWPGAPLQILDEYRFGGFERGHDEEEQMLGQFETWLLEDVDQRAEAAIDAVCPLVSPAAIWRVLLRSLASSDLTLARLMPLLVSHAALLSSGLSHAIGEALEAGFIHLSSSDRARIEEAITTLDEVDDDPARIGRIGDRLISSLPAGALMTDRAQKRLAALPSNDDLVKDRATAPRLGADEAGDEDLRYLGVDPDQPSNMRLRLVGAPVRAFVSTYLNTAPDTSTSSGAWREIQATWNEASLGEAESPLVNSSKADVAQALEVLVRTGWPTELGEDDLRSLHAITLALSNEDAPPEPTDSEDLDLHIFRAGEPRLAAAEIITSLLRLGVGAPLRPRLLELSTDSSMHVRRAVVVNLYRILDVDRAAVDEVMNRESERETSGAVLTHLIWLLTRLHLDAEDLLTRVSHLYQRSLELGDRGKPVREAACQVAAGWLIWRDSRDALDFTHRLLSNPETPAYELGALQNEFRHAFEAGDADVRARAFSLALQTQNVAAERARAAIGAIQGLGEGDRPEAQELMKQWGHVIESIANDVYFSSGAYERSGDDEQAPKPPIDIYYGLARELLQALLEVPYPSVVHHVVETLDYLSPANPAAVFIDIANAVARGREGGYEYDPLGEPILVGIVRRYLAYDRGLFQSNQECRNALIDILDTLVVTGSRDATALTYQLQDVFR